MDSLQTSFFTKEGAIHRTSKSKILGTSALWRPFDKNSITKKNLLHKKHGFNIIFFRILFPTLITNNRKKEDHMVASKQISPNSFQNLISSYPVPVPQKDKLTRLLEKAIACNQHDNPIDALWAAKRGIRLATTIRQEKNDALGRLYVEQAIAYRTLGKV